MSRSLLCPRCRALVTDDSRTSEANGAFFAFLEYCVGRWPTECTFAPNDKDHLRAWAMVRTSHLAPSMAWKFANERERKVLQPFIDSMIAHELRDGRYVWAQTNDGGIELLRPKSINWKSVGQREFNKIFEDVINLIAEYTGINFDKWKATERADRSAA
jgi:hypothetical protein